MIGLKVINNSTGEHFTLTAIDGTDRLVLTPDVFGALVPVTTMELAESFSPVESDAEMPVTLPPTEQDIILRQQAEANDGLNARYARGVLRGGHATDADLRGARSRVSGPPEGSPEAVFADLAAEAPDDAPVRSRTRRGKTSLGRS